MRPGNFPATGPGAVRGLHRVAAAVALIALLLTAAPTRAESPDPTHGDVVLFPAPSEIEFEPRPSPAGTPAAQADPAPAASFRRQVGLHIPGTRFRAGTGWWKLLCRADGGCRLAAARLSIANAIHPIYDSAPVPSQVLGWLDVEGTPKPPVAGEVVLAVFKPLRSLAALPLQAGQVPTFLHQAMADYPGTAELGRRGTMEVRVPTPGTTTLLIPRLLRNPDPHAQTAPDAPAAEGDRLALELRINDRRQRLGEFDTEGIEGLQPRGRKQYLLWSGDLDGDGQPDFLVDFSGANSRDIALFLSSLAPPGQLVGEAGRFRFSDPSMAGC